MGIGWVMTFRLTPPQTSRSTLLIVTGFIRPAFKVEVDVTAARIP
jgi:hypothetical protein